MEQILIKDKKYYGHYVAIEDFKKPVIICYGKDPNQVYEDAIKKGYPEPVIIFIPTKNMVQIYWFN